MPNLAIVDRLRHSRGPALVAIAAALIAGAAIVSPPAAHAASGDAETINAMAPLFIHDYATGGTEWKAFTTQLSTFKSMGGDAVSVDVWWGEVQQSTPDVFDWSYYDAVFQAITDAGLEIVPIMSFHQCGGNVGDTGDCSTPITLPDFVWQDVDVCGFVRCTSLPADDWYLSEYGNQSKEAVAPWGPGTQRAYDYMGAFMDEFEAHYSSTGHDYRHQIQELNISTGPAGELRYPSYNAHDAMVPGSPADYPNRGVFQSYTNSAITAFRNWVIAKYGSVSAVGTAWSISGLTRDMISPPTDHERFIDSGAYYSLQYGRDFTEWYNASLLGHGEKVLDQAIGAFDDEFAAIPLGIKVPGIHWQTMSSSPMRRAPEIAAGLISTKLNYNDASTDMGYDPLLSMIASEQANGNGTSAPKHQIILHFTALEKPNLEWDGSAHAYSAAADEVGWVADAAAKAGVTLKGENALSGGLYSDGSSGAPGWSHIRAAFDRDPRYHGLTVLRISDVTNGGLAQSEMTDFIRDYG